LAAWRSAKRSLDEDFFFAAAVVDGFFFGDDPEDPGRLEGMTVLFSLSASAGKQATVVVPRQAKVDAPWRSPWQWCRRAGAGG
jgi:hypothetical protein